MSYRTCILEIREEGHMHNNDFRIRRYRIPTAKLDHEVRICFLTDWHASKKSLTGSFLINILRQENPDLILVGGDMATAASFESLKTADRFMREAGRRWQVYYARGNHETRLYQSDLSHKRYMEYIHRLKKAGVCFLDNTHETFETGGNKIEIYGFSLPMGYYRKPFPPSLSYARFERTVGKVPDDRLCILLAHTPLYAEQYFAWGADLILCGHYHGGVVRFDEHHGAVSPQLVLFPRYCCGEFKKGGSTLITGAGLGEHGFLPGFPHPHLPLRYNNPREFVTIDLIPSGEQETLNGA